MQNITKNMQKDHFEKTQVKYGGVMFKHENNFLGDLFSAMPNVISPEFLLSSTLYIKPFMNSMDFYFRSSSHEDSPSETSSLACN